MNILKPFFAIILTIFFLSCSTTEKLVKNDIYSTTWELEYLSGPRIAFEGLFPDKKPQIVFNKASRKVEGMSGCNGYAADYTLNDDQISFGEPGPTTMIFCGNGEKTFLNTIKKINKFKIDEEGKLILMINDTPMMRFRKVAPL